MVNFELDRVIAWKIHSRLAFFAMQEKHFFLRSCHIVCGLPLHLNSTVSSYLKCKLARSMFMYRFGCLRYTSLTDAYRGAGAMNFVCGADFRLYTFF